MNELQHGLELSIEFCSSDSCSFSFHGCSIRSCKADFFWRSIQGDNGKNKGGII